MAKWLPESEARLAEYLNHVARLARAQGDDAAEITMGLRAHIVLEAEAAGDAVVTLDRLQHVIGNVGTPEEVTGSYVPLPGRTAEPSRSVPQKNAPRVSPVLALEILPAMAIGVEALFGVMGAIYADPMPSAMHLLLLIGVPAAGAYLLREAQKFETEGLGGQRVLCALAASGYLIGIAASYSAFYFVTIPFFCIAILAMGLGLLGLSPHFALIGAIIQARFWNNAARQAGIAGKARMKALAAGLLIPAAFLLSYAARDMFIVANVSALATNDTGARKSAIRSLKWLLGEHTLLQRSYVAPLPRARMFGGFDDSDEGGAVRLTLTTTEYRSAYFALTGRSFNTQPRPLHWRAFLVSFFEPGTSPDGVWWRGRDNERGQQAVESRIRNLSLDTSTMDVVFGGGGDGSAGPGLTYTEWIIEFKNTNPGPVEARGLLGLPHDGVISRLTLWVNGVESEAAVGERSRVIEAYRNIAVEQRRDPALVSTAGPDRAIVQCFPVPANGTMKIKLGITAPLSIIDGKAMLRLPSFLETNFDIAANTPHAVWAEGPAEVHAAVKSLKEENPKPGVHAVRGKIRDSELRDPAAGVLLFKASSAPAAYHAALGELRAEMRVEPAANTASKAPIWIAADSSPALDEAGIDWGKLLNAFPPEAEMHGVRIGGAYTAEVSGGDVRDRSALAAWLEDRQRGGVSPVYIVERACEEASATPNGRVLWIHGPCSYVDGAMMQSIQQIARRRPLLTPEGAPRLYSYCAAPGENWLYREMDAFVGHAVLPNAGAPMDVLAHFAKVGAAEDIARTYTLYDDPAKAPPALAGVEAGDHLVRLAVADLVAKNWRTEKDGIGVLVSLVGETTPLSKLASRMRLVTPITGAVVLENQQQYQQFGLDNKANQDAVPAIPEPEEYALMAVALAGLACMAIYRRKQRMAAV